MEKQITKTILEKKNKVGEIKLPAFKIYYIVTAIRICDIGGGKDTMEENPEIGPHKYAQLVFDKGVKAIKQKKHSLLNKWYWSKGTSMGGKKKKRAKSQNLGKNTGESLQDLRWGKDFLDQKHDP